MSSTASTASTAALRTPRLCQGVQQRERERRRGSNRTKMKRINGALLILVHCLLLSDFKISLFLPQAEAFIVRPAVIHHDLRRSFCCYSHSSCKQHHASSTSLQAHHNSNHPPVPPTILLLDIYNILGHTAFSLTPSALISRAAAWRDSRDGCEAMACVVDHGANRCAHQHGPLADRCGVMFAGPSLTADDVIVSLVKERCLGGGGGGGGDEGTDTEVSDSTESSNGPNTTVVITADANLINRCQRQRREASSSWNAKSDLVFVEPASFLRELEKHAYADNDLFSGITFDFPAYATGETEDSLKENNAKETSYTDVNEVTTAATSADTRNGDEQPAEDIVDTFLKETAVERTLIARTRLVRDFNAKTKRRGKTNRSRSGGRNSLSARQRNKLIAKQKRAQRHSKFAIATSSRKVQAEKLREQLVAAGTEQDHDMPVRRLLQWLAVPIDVGLTGFEGRADASSSLLKWSAGADDNLSDPLSALLHVPRRQKGPIVSNDNLGRPLRAIVISDTHGFEAALAKLPNPEAPVAEVTDEACIKGDKKNAQYLLPDADVLIHCGDFAANGSRMRQRESIRRLDSFFAHQKHIKHKIVVRGNHDPDTPGRVLFKKSKALYATTPFRLSIEGIKFALQPFSRRAHATVPHMMQKIANADILVSHEPPRGVLDLTYSGMRVGSKVLRHAVENSKTKPRCWLCGHIHEGRGAAREIFTTNGKECEEATLVVNASNANFGKANRLVSGAVLLDIEREALHDNDNDDSDFSIVDMVQVEAKDLGLDAISVRPGVRRRKGVGHSRRR